MDTGCCVTHSLLASPPAHCPYPPPARLSDLAERLGREDEAGGGPAAPSRFAAELGGERGLLAMLGGTVGASKFRPGGRRVGGQLEAAGSNCDSCTALYVCVITVAPAQAGARCAWTSARASAGRPLRPKSACAARPSPATPPSPCVSVWLWVVLHFGEPGCCWEQSCSGSVAGAAAESTLRALRLLLRPPPPCSLHR